MSNFQWYNIKYEILCFSLILQSNLIGFYILKTYQSGISGISYCALVKNSIQLGYLSLRDVGDMFNPLSDQHYKKNRAYFMT